MSISQMTSDEYEAWMLAPVGSEALYDWDFLPAIEAKYPNLETERADDFIHEKRVSIRLPPEVSRREFYTFALEQGFALELLGFQFMLMSESSFAREMREYIEQHPRAESGGPR
jgi:hypothetical protein